MVWVPRSKLLSSKKWDGSERRKADSNRRTTERRSSQERRFDKRVGAQSHKRGFYRWIRTLINVRLGVDRRKNVDRRDLTRNRRLLLQSILTKDEIADLLK